MITFTKTRFKNFGSFGNSFTEIDLCKDRTTLVSGGNGNGKSFAFLDSITYGLFGKPFRKINIPQLVNSINEKNCLVEVEFNIGSDEYLIRRGIVPKVFEIHKNGQLVNQTAKAKDYQRYLEEHILKMNYKSFTQVVILGSSSFVPFMQLPAADRRAVIEDILDINVFSVMNQILKSRISTNKEELREYEYKIDVLKEKVDVIRRYIDAEKEKNKETITRKQSDIDKTKQVVLSLNESIESLSNQANKLLEETKSEQDIVKKLSKMETLKSQMNRNIKKIDDDLKFFDEIEDCPTCMQRVDKDSESIKTYVQSKADKADTIKKGIRDIEVLIEQETKTLTEIRNTLGKVSDIQLEVSEKNKQLFSANNHIKQLEQDINEIKNSKNQTDDEKKKLDDLQNQYDKLVLDKKHLVEDRHYYDIAGTILKDGGIKRKIIQHYLPIMNKLINKFLTSMDFFANFTLDEEFNETIKSRHRDTFSYMSFSEGEKLRIDLALLLAWREVARIKNSANTNILILDEVFDSSLDAVGTDEFLKLLQSIAGETHIFVISHKADQLIDKFDANVSFTKKNNFSKMVVN